MNNYPHLFSPVKIGNIEIPNRIVHVPTDISSSGSDGEVSERDIYHHGEIAKGGTGLIIVGATTPDAKTGRPTVTCLVADNDNYIPGLARLAEAMHRYGAKCAVQLQHPGRQCALPRYSIMSANDMVIKIPWSAGHEIVYANAEEKGKSVRAMTTDEVLEMVELLSEAAWRVKQAGFDAVELHAAHGYLMSQFMSPALNRRIDRFGGSFENRMRFPLAIIASIKKKCGKDFPVLVRYSAEEWIDGGRDLEESKKVAAEFEKAGVAAIDLSQSVQERPGAGADPMFYREGWTMYASEAIKQIVSIPVINSHTLRNPDACEAMLAEGKTDMVGLSRQLLADPYWPVKAKLGRDNEIRRCISCLTGCWQESMMAKREIKCAINPACGEESFRELKRSEKPLNIAVVGGGPAGMEAARVAAVRGHNVTVFERTGELGGAILGCCAVPGKDKMKWYADWIRGQIKELGVEVMLRCEPAPEDLKRYDAVLNAAGASSYVPDCIGADKVIGFESVIACPKVSCEYYPGERKNLKTGGNVLVWGDHYAAVDTVMFLASIGKSVTVVTENKEFGSTVELKHMYVIRKRFRQEEAEALEPKPYKYPVTIIQDSTVYEVKDGEVIVQDKNFKKTVLEGIDTVITCHLRPNSVMFDALKALGIPVFNAGDSIAPRNLHTAVSEGAKFGLNIDEEMIINPNGAVMNSIPLDVLGQLKR